MLRKRRTSEHPDHDRAEHGLESATAHSDRDGGSKAFGRDRNASASIPGQAIRYPASAGDSLRRSRFAPVRTSATAACKQRHAIVHMKTQRGLPASPSLSRSLTTRSTRDVARAVHAIAIGAPPTGTSRASGPSRRARGSGPTAAMPTRSAGQSPQPRMRRRAPCHRRVAAASRSAVHRRTPSSREAPEDWSGTSTNRDLARTRSKRRAALTQNGSPS